MNRWEFTKRSMIALAAVSGISFIFSCTRTRDETKTPTAVSDRSQTEVTPATKQQAVQVPSVQEAILIAIDRSKQAKLFSHRSVEIAASNEADGSVKVLFSIPTSDVMVTAGRKATNPFYEVMFTPAGISSRVHGETSGRQPKLAGTDAQVDGLTRAVLAVCARLSFEGDVEFALNVFEDRDNFSVMVKAVPYRPGGHILYIVSREFEILETAPGL